jgi:hypothetical protein
MQGEMPGFPFPGRPGGEHDEPLLDMIIARRALPPDAPREMHDLARMLAALAGPAEPGELATEAAVRAAFRRAAAPVGVSSAARRPTRHRRSRRSRAPSRSRARLATALVVAAAGLGSVLAAYADVLPSPVQQLAHVTVAAPAPHHAGSLPSAAAAGARRAAPGTLQPASRPGPGPAHTRETARPSGHGQTAKAHFPPVVSPPPGQVPTWQACSPVPTYPPGPSPTASPSRTPAWRQAVYCPSTFTWPSSQPSLHPYSP